ncbi:MAG TPA: DUF4097 family beta strand repeat-containing protein [Longimicrobiales bacterium]|nr:DUF4097 family beta strand repeat-containing protein [Longimicrobiales bacterium]
MKNVVWAALALLAGWTPLDAQDRFSIDAERVAIYNLAGEVRLEAGSGSQVVVEMTRGGREGDQLEVRRGQADGWQQLIVRYPSNRIVYDRLGRLSRNEFTVHRDGTFGLRDLDPQHGVERIKSDRRPASGSGGRVRVAGSGRGLAAHADLVVRVPLGRAVAVHLGTGKVFVSNVNGDVQIDARSAAIEAFDVSGFGRFDTGSGSILLNNATGDFGLHTGSGSVVIKTMRRGGALVVHTGSGGVQTSNSEVSELDINTGSGRVTLNTVTAPTTRVTTGSGGIRAHHFGTRNFDLHTGSGSVLAELTSDLQVGRIRTRSGSVQIALPDEMGADVTVDTGSGGIDPEAARIDISESRRGYLRGTIGNGDGTLRISTGSGRVSFRSY